MATKKQFEVALVLTAADKASKIIAEVTTNAEKRIKGMSELGDKAFSVGRNTGAVGLGMAAVIAMPLKAAADMESMNIALKTSFQGNEAAAKKAFDNINQFAAKTPYELEEVMTGFIKLKNMGLDPSQDALTAYGNTASSMGKSLNDMVEAVADAATGEFERLKEFGIKASSEGDKVTFTFQGVKTTVGKNSKEIERYLKYIGNQKFAGGIEAQSKSIKGQLSTLKDGIMMTAAKVGTTLIPKLNELFQKVGPVIDKVGKWVEKNPHLTGTIMKAAVGLTALTLSISAASFVFGGLSKAISFAMSIGKAYNALMLLMKAGQMAYTFTLLSTGSGFQAVQAGLKAMNLGFLTSPIFWMVAGFVALIAVGYLIVKNWDKIKAFFIELWGYVKQAFSKFFNWINSLFLKYSPVLLIYNNWSKITGFFSKLWDNVKMIFSKFINFALFIPAKFLAIGSDIIMGVWNGIKNKASGLFDFVKGIGKKIADTFKSVLGIASPSKVFMEFGGHITQGLSNGIDKGSSKPIGSASSMGKAITPNAISGGGRFSGGGITVNFSPTITGGNGSDTATDLKKLIPQLVREIESAMARKQRLAY